MLTFIARQNEIRRSRRRAGSRARRKYTALRRAWLRRHRKVWIIATVVALALWIVFTLVMDLFPGDQTWISGAFAGALVATLIALRQSPPISIASWEEGAWGEEQTAKRLQTLEREGWVVLHDLANGSANFDHVVLGPAGVFCLNSKSSGYRLEQLDDGRLVGRHKYDDDITMSIDSKVRRARAEAAALSQQIERRCGHRVWVQPVIVWWGDVSNGGKTVDGVGIVQGENLVDRLRALPGRRITDFARVEAVLRPGRHTRQSAHANVPTGA